MIALPQQLDSPLEPWQPLVQADNRVATGIKRARSEGPRGDGDWTCPLCGNINFAFRATCNMRKCGGPKPADAQRSVGVPMGQSPFDQTPPAMYMAGPGMPPQMQIAMNGAYAALPMPPPVSGVTYDYGAMSIPAGYSPIPIPGYGPGAIIGAGPGYAGPMMDGYGMNMAMVRPPFPVLQLPGPRPGLHIEENGSRKRRGEGTSEGDWLCPKCGNSNFAFRTFCNMRKCGTPKPAEPTPRVAAAAAPQKSTSQGPPPEGSWTCDACGNVNYPFRTKCNRRNCGADKPAEAKLTATTNSPSE